jgi:hypothetical protein
VRCGRHSQRVCKLIYLCLFVKPVESTCHDVLPDVLYIRRVNSSHILPSASPLHVRFTEAVYTCAAENISVIFLAPILVRGNQWSRSYWNRVFEFREVYRYLFTSFCITFLGYLMTLFERIRSYTTGLNGICK